MKILALFLLSISISYADTDNSNNVICGTDKDDNLKGSDNKDEIYGGAGDDIIFGAVGADILYGGSGADTFVIEPVKNPESRKHDIPQIQDYDASEGDQVVLELQTKRNLREKLGIPRRITYQNIQIDRKGDVKILLDNEEWLPIVNLKESDLAIRIEDDTDNIKLTFERKF